MTWTEPEYSKRRVDAAGRTYIALGADATERELALAVVNNWRSSHSFPLNTFQMTLRRRARQLDPEADTAQRVKRLPSIAKKLRERDGMRLSRMNDIGGCRAVLADVSLADDLVRIYQEGSFKHRLVREDPYMRQPKTSGYRSHHLVYRYHSDKMETFNGMLIEVQIRSRIQHAWATAVETVGTFIQQALKSSQGEDKWLRFFALMSSELAAEEDLPSTPGTPDRRDEVRAELRDLVAELNVLTRLEAYGQALEVLSVHQDRGHSFYVLDLDVPRETLNITAYRSNDRAAAELDYQATERAATLDAGRDVVLVSAESVSALRRAYPNYFLDTTEFRRWVGRAVA